jgi:hypothetical protein
LRRAINQRNRRKKLGQVSLVLLDQHRFRFVPDVDLDSHGHLVDYEDGPSALRSSIGDYASNDADWPAYLVETSLVKLLQPKFPPDPNLWSSSIDRQDVAHLKIIARTESTDPIAIQNR